MKLAYCDLIANTIKQTMKHETNFRLGDVRMDLHPEYGYFISTKKTITVTDMNGKDYMITIEEIVD